MPSSLFLPGGNDQYDSRQGRDIRKSSGSISPGGRGYSDRQSPMRGDREPSVPSTARSSPPMMIDRQSPLLEGINTSLSTGGRDLSPPPPRDRRMPPSGAQFPPDRSQWPPQAPMFRPPFPAPGMMGPPPPNTMGFRSKSSYLFCFCCHIL